MGEVADFGHKKAQGFVKRTTTQFKKRARPRHFFDAYSRRKWEEKLRGGF